MEEIDARRGEYTVSGNDRTAEPGRWFTLSGYFGDVDANRKYLITSVHHHATNNYQDGHAATSHYANDISCIVQSIPWRPGRNFHSVTPKIYGVQTAVVVGHRSSEATAHKGKNLRTDHGYMCGRRRCSCAASFVARRRRRNTIFYFSA
ncbi:MAG: contractile injection system protein, VgrG/Pvc8 family [Pseudomonadota bacterium]|nr:contractile injection system protein, VgrG/Pvc8 family [Pseudomonadota bacterium]